MEEEVVVKFAGKIVGITGGIGSGKSVVSRILRLNDFPVYDCDIMARNIMETDSGMIAALIDILGKETYDCRGCLDRNYVSGKIFSDRELLEKVNSTVHLAVREDFLRFADRQVSDFVFCESAILGTSGFVQMCDEVWNVCADDDVRISRVMKRNGLSKGDVEKRMENQKNEDRALIGFPVVTLWNNPDSCLLEEVLKMTRKNNINTEIKCLEKF